MDNTLIDERRIHIDFSQSVAKFNFFKKKTYGEKKFFKTNFIIYN